MDFTNYQKAIFLLDETKTIRALLAQYEADEHAKKEMLKTFDPDIQVGDFVIVPTTTRHEMTVARISDVDVPPAIDKIESCKWVIAKIDRGPFVALEEQEKRATEAIKAAKQRAAEKDIKEAFLQGLNEGDLVTIPKIEAPKT